MNLILNPKILLKNNSSSYEILGLNKDATSNEIKKSYKNLCMLFHPDRNGNKSEATAAFKIIEKAYNDLKGK